jgi:hypothetical protein
MEQKIKSISEAYSTTPMCHEICKFDHGHGVECIKEIKTEVVVVGARGFEEPLIMCVGYNYDSQKAFEYLRNSVNINYDNTPHE